MRISPPARAYYSVTVAQEQGQFAVCRQQTTLTTVPVTRCSAVNFDGQPTGRRPDELYMGEVCETVFMQTRRLGGQFEPPPYAQAELWAQPEPAEPEAPRGDAGRFDNLWNAEPAIAAPSDPAAGLIPFIAVPLGVPLTRLACRRIVASWQLTSFVRHWEAVIQAVQEAIHTTDSQYFIFVTDQARELGTAYAPPLPFGIMPHVEFPCWRVQVNDVGLQSALSIQPISAVPYEPGRSTSVLQSPERLRGIGFALADWQPGDDTIRLSAFSREDIDRTHTITGINVDRIARVARTGAILTNPAIAVISALYGLVNNGPPPEPEARNDAHDAVAALELAFGRTGQQEDPEVRSERTARQRSRPQRPLETNAMQERQRRRRRQQLPPPAQALAVLHGDIRWQEDCWRPATLQHAEDADRRDWGPGELLPVDELLNVDLWHALVYSVRNRLLLHEYYATNEVVHLDPEDWLGSRSLFQEIYLETMSRELPLPADVAEILHNMAELPPAARIDRRRPWDRERADREDIAEPTTPSMPVAAWRQNLRHFETDSERE